MEKYVKSLKNPGLRNLRSSWLNRAFQPALPSSSSNGGFVKARSLGIRRQVWWGIEFKRIAFKKLFVVARDRRGPKKLRHFLIQFHEGFQLLPMVLDLGNGSERAAGDG